MKSGFLISHESDTESGSWLSPWLLPPKHSHPSSCLPRAVMTDIAGYLVKLTSYGSGMCQAPNKEFQSSPEQISLKRGFLQIIGSLICKHSTVSYYCETLFPMILVTIFKKKNLTLYPVLYLHTHLLRKDCRAKLIVDHEPYSNTICHRVKFKI